MVLAEFASVSLILYCVDLRPWLYNSNDFTAVATLCALCAPAAVPGLVYWRNPNVPTEGWLLAVFLYIVALRIHVLWWLGWT